MAKPHNPWARRAIGLAAALMLVPVVAGAADEGSKPKSGAKAKAKAARPAAEAAEKPATQAERAEAAAILRDLRALAASAREESGAPAEKGSIEALLARVKRPARSAETPSLTPGEIDKMIEARLAEAKVAPARLVGDEEFARRACLDVTGKLPTPEQVLAFVRDKDPKKRARLIDSLLESPDYGRNWGRYWRDVVAYRATNEQRNLIRYENLESWLAGQFNANRPWDEVAREMIAGTGSNEENGAVVLHAAHQAQAVEVAGEVSRIFMGVQIQCAQCHDHPTDPWKREQFHEFAAFFAGATARPNRAEPKARPTGITVRVRPGRARYTMPDLKDPQKNIPVEPKFFLASEGAELPKNLSAEQRRALAASYVTGQDNPWFARAFVNRAWYALVGEGFYNPIDDMGPAREATMPEVLDRLADEWARGGYDVKWLYRTILNTKAYQRQFRSTQSASGRTSFAANCPSRLRADQLLDALGQALGFDPEAPGARREMRRGGVGAGATALRRGPFNPRALFNVLFGVDPSTPNEDVMGTIPQALFLMNSPQVNRAMTAARGTVLAEILDQNPDNAAALNALYLRVLARRPTEAEAKTCLAYAMKLGNRREAFEDILWALINSTEFVSRR